MNETITRCAAPEAPAPRAPGPRQEAIAMVSLLVAWAIGAFAMGVLSSVSASIVVPEAPAADDPVRHRISCWILACLIPAAAASLSVLTVRRDLLERDWWAGVVVGVPGPFLVVAVSLAATGMRTTSDFSAGMVPGAVSGVIVQFVMMVVASLLVGSWRRRALRHRGSRRGQAG